MYVFVGLFLVLEVLGNPWNMSFLPSIGSNVLKLMYQCPFI